MSALACLLALAALALRAAAAPHRPALRPAALVPALLWRNAPPTHRHKRFEEFPCAQEVPGDLYQVRQADGRTTLQRLRFAGADVPSAGGGAAALGSVAFETMTMHEGLINGAWGMWGGGGDGNAYGLVKQDVYRITADGVVTKLATLPEAPTKLIVCGEVLPDGTLVAFDGSRLNFIDIGTVPPRWLGQKLVSRSVSTVDFALNPADGLLYGVSLDTDRLFHLNLDTLELVKWGPAQYQSVYGAAFFDNAGGVLYLFNNPSGEFSWTSVGSFANGDGERNSIAVGPASNANDGLSCRGAPPVKLGFAVGDSVWLDTNANGVLDELDLPLPGVEVELRSVGGGAVLASTTSGPSGLYSFRSVVVGAAFVERGAYELSIALDQPALANWLQPTAANVGGDDALDSDGVQRGNALVAPFTAPVDGGDLRSLDFGFLGAALGGRVVEWPSNRPLFQVDVTLYDERGDGVLASTRTRRDGRFTFFAYQVLGLAPESRYTVVVDAASGEAALAPFGFQRRADDTVLRSVNGSPALFEATLRSGAVGELLPETDLPLEPVFASTLTVFLDRNNDGERQESEPGLAGVHVELLRPNGAETLTAVTDGGGDAIFLSRDTARSLDDQLVPGAAGHRFRFSLAQRAFDGVIISSLPQASIDGDVVTVGIGRLPPAGATEHVLAAFRVWAVGGTVSAPDAPSVPCVQVELAMVDGRRRKRQSGTTPAGIERARTVARTETLANGRFAFTAKSTLPLVVEDGAELHLVVHLDQEPLRGLQIAAMGVGEFYDAATNAVRRPLVRPPWGDVVLDAYNFEFVEAGQTFAPTPAPTPAPPAAPAGEESDPSAVPDAVDAVLATVAGSACISAHVERDGVCQPDSACEARYASRSPAALRTKHPISLRPGHVVGTNALELVVEHPAVLNRNVTGIVLNEANAACNYPGIYWRKGVDMQADSYCSDVYVSAIPWMTDCALERTQNSTHVTFAGTGKVFYKDTFAFDGRNLTREWSSVVRFELVQPRVIRDISTSVRVFDDPRLLSVVTRQAYSYKTGVAQMRVVLSLVAPLQTRGVIGTGGPSGLGIRPLNGGAPVDIGKCADEPGAVCQQAYDFEIDPNGLCEFSGAFDFAFDTGCRDSVDGTALCPLAASAPLVPCASLNDRVSSAECQETLAQLECPASDVALPLSFSALLASENLCDVARGLVEPSGSVTAHREFDAAAWRFGPEHFAFFQNDTIFFRVRVRSANDFALESSALLNIRLRNAVGTLVDVMVDGESLAGWTLVRYVSPANAEAGSLEHEHAFSLTAAPSRFGDVPRLSPVDSDVEVDVRVFIAGMGSRRKRQAQTLTLQSAIDRSQDPDLLLVLPPEEPFTTASTKISVVAAADSEMPLRSPSSAANASAAGGREADIDDELDLELDLQSKATRVTLPFVFVCAVMLFQM